MTVLTIHEIPSPRCWRISDPTALHGFSLEMQLTDHRPGQGTLTVRHDGNSWTHYWSAMGGQTVMQFLAVSDAHYVVNKLQPSIDDEIIDWDRTRELIRANLTARADDPDDEYSHSSLRDDLWQLERTDDHDMQGTAGYELLGHAFRTFDVECWELPKIPNPDYQRLERLVSMCIDACKELTK